MESGIRRRNVASSPSKDKASAASKALDTLKRFDVYQKVEDDYVQKSQSGGIVSMITAVILTLLFYVELCEFCSVDTVHTFEVDTRTNQQLPISVNISFPALRCDEVSVDTINSIGMSQASLEGSLAKLPLDASGSQIVLRTPGKDECLSCLGAEDDAHRCCNTCVELKAAYTDLGLDYSRELRESPQCSDHKGCRIEGKVVVLKVSGNVHVALGKSRTNGGKHVHEFSNQDVGAGFNTSHEIHALFFGDRPEGARSPLEGSRRTVKHGAYMFHYYIKLVPTVIEDRWSEELYTYQYTFSDSARNVQAKSGELSGLPGVFFVYDLSAFMMRTASKAKPWSYIFTSMCAIVGGVFSIAMLVERVVTNMFRGRPRAGKPAVL